LEKLLGFNVSLPLSLSVHSTGAEKGTRRSDKPGDPPPKGLKGLVHNSLIAINTLGDHLDASGKTLMDSAGKSSSQVVHHKWGSEARGIADSAGGSVKRTF